MKDENKALYTAFRDTEHDKRALADTFRLVESLPFVFSEGKGRYSAGRLKYVEKRISRLQSDELKKILLEKIQQYEY